MREITKYVANDGTVFEDYDECKAYETELAVKGCEAKAFDWDGNPIDILKWDDTFYMYIPNEIALKSINTFADDYGFSVPDKVGKWLYSAEDDKWESVDTRIKYFKKEIDKLTNIFKGVDNED